MVNGAAPLEPPSELATGSCEGQGAYEALLKIGKWLPTPNLARARRVTQEAGAYLKARRVTADDPTRQRAAIVAAFVFLVKKDELGRRARLQRCAPASTPSSAQSVAVIPVQLCEQSMPHQRYELRLDQSKNVSALEQELEQSKVQVQGLLTTNVELVVHA
jgi:hypothetical protein